MFKGIVSKALIIAVIGSFPLLAADLRLGFISSEEIFQKYEGTKEAQDKFNKEVAVWEQQATNMQKEIKDLQDQLEKQSLLLTNDRKREIEDKLKQKVATYQKFLQEKLNPQEGEAYKRNAELTKPIIDKINVIIAKIAKDENYDFIFDQKAGGIVFAKPAYDLTDRVILLLNKEGTK
jgi:outer membrane protein